MNHSRLLMTSALLTVCSFLQAHAASPDISRAVSAPNLSVSAQGGTLGGDGAAALGASGSIPLGNSFGLQVDGVALRGNDHKDDNGVGGHLFYREPSRFLAGITALHASVDGANVNRYGAEAELYLDHITIAPAGGIQRGDANSGSDAFYKIKGSYYATDNLKLSLGATGYSNVNGGFGTVEWQPAVNQPLAIFAHAGKANEGDGFALAGIRYTFGAPGSSLKHRDRTGDPSNDVEDMLLFTGAPLTADSHHSHETSGGGGT